MPSQHPAVPQGPVTRCRPVATAVARGDSAPAVPSRSFAVGLASLVAAALGMSISPILVRLADVGPFASAFWRVALALPVLWAWMRWAEPARAAPPSGEPLQDGRAQAPAAARFSWATILAGLAFAGDLFFWHLALMKTSVANATFFATAAPIWVVLFGWLLLRQRVGRTVLRGLTLCILGGAALVGQSFAFRPDHMVGDGLGLATGIFFGLYFLAVGAARGRSTAARVTFELSVVAVSVLFVVAMVAEPHVLPRSLGGWSVLLALGLISHAGGQGLLSVALGRLPTVFSSLVIFLEAIAAAVFAWVILGEPVSWVQATGGVLILAGIWVARPRRAD